MRKFLLTLLMLVAAVGWASADDVYELVTDASTLANGDQILIVNTSAKKALGTSGTNNRKAVDVTITSNTITPGSDVQVITLESVATTDGTTQWNFNVGDSKYLYAASSSSNNLKSGALSTATTNANATIVISTSGTATITFQGSNTRNLLQYNSGSKIFSCYSSGQTSVEIYKLKVVFSDVIFTYNSGNYKNGETISAKEGEKITIFSEGATALEINGQTYDNSEDWIYTVTSDETQTISVTPSIGETKGTESSTVTVNKKADDALDAPVITGSINETLPSGAYHPQTITISSTSNLGYSINGKGDLILKDGETGKASVTIEFDKTYLDNGLTITAYSIDDDLNDETKSETVTREYTILRPDAPTFSVESGDIVKGQKVTITATGDDLQRLEYILDPGEDTDPIKISEGETSISTEITITEDIEIIATAYDKYGIPSENASAKYTAVVPDTYKLVKSTDYMLDGAKYIMLAASSATGRVMLAGSKNSAGNRQVIIIATDGNVPSEVTLTGDAANAAIFTISATEDGYTIKDGTSYVGSSETTKNGNLTYSETTSTTWTISYSDDSKATIKVGSAIIQCLNQKNSEIIKTYTSSQILPYLYRYYAPDQSELESAELGNIESVDADINLDATEGYTDKYPAKYTTVNKLPLSLTINGDIDAETAVYTVAVTPETKDAIEYTLTGEGKHTILVPLAASYDVNLTGVTTDSYGKEDLTRDAKSVNGPSLTFIDIDKSEQNAIGAGENIVINWSISNIDANYNPYVTFSDFAYDGTAFDAANVGVATADYFTNEANKEVGLTGYENYNAENGFQEANNWAKIAANEQRLPLNFIGVEEGQKITGKINVVYPFLLSDGSLDKVVKSVTVEHEIQEGALQTGVESILVNGNGKVEYFNLQGVRVMNPANGVYIRRQGNSVDKVFVK